MIYPNTTTKVSYCLTLLDEDTGREFSYPLKSNSNKHVRSGFKKYLLEKSIVVNDEEDESSASSDEEEDDHKEDDVNGTMPRLAFPGDDISDFEADSFEDESSYYENSYNSDDSMPPLVQHVPNNDDDSDSDVDNDDGSMPPLVQNVPSDDDDDDDDSSDDDGSMPPLVAYRGNDSSEESDSSSSSG
jgi:hypothetical protein